MSVADPIRRMLRGWQRRDWAGIAADYLANPLDFWGAHAPRHAEKVETKKRAIRERDGLSDDDIIDAVVSMAAKRRVGRPAPVSVTGLGGSGSHWLSGMLGDLGGLVAAGEVYLPRALLERFDGLDDADQACAVDAIGILHGWPRSNDVWAAGIVNCAAGVGRLPMYKRWFPDAVGIYLMRDPRDQVLSVTFRKTGFREYEDPDASDDEYLLRMARRNAAGYREYLGVRDRVDITCRYEDLREDPRPVLGQVLTALGRAVDPSLVDRVVAEHDAATIRAGDSSATSNLDGGGVARPWHEAADPAQQRTLHAHLVDVIHGLGYPPGDCMGTHLPDSQLPARTFTFARAAPGPLYQRVDGIWTPLDIAGGTAVVEAGTPVLLRIGADDPGDLRALDGHAADDLQALCLAGNGGVDDAALAHLRSLTRLQTLDLARTPVTDDGLSTLTMLTGLQQINLAQTGTTAQGRARLAAELPQLTIWT